MKTEAWKLQLSCHKPEKAWSYQKLKETRKDPALEALEKHGLADTLTSDFWPPWTVKEFISFIFSHQSLWLFVIATLGNQNYKEFGLYFLGQRNATGDIWLRKQYYKDESVDTGKYRLAGEQD